jgi:hypothetical protein
MVLELAPPPRGHVGGSGAFFFCFFTTLLDHRNTATTKNSTGKESHSVTSVGATKKAGSHFARDDKEPGPSWGKLLPEERPR